MEAAAHDAALAGRLRELHLDAAPPEFFDHVGVGAGVRDQHVQLFDVRHDRDVSSHQLGELRDRDFSDEGKLTIRRLVSKFQRL